MKKHEGPRQVTKEWVDRWEQHRPAYNDPYTNFESIRTVWPGDVAKQPFTSRPRRTA